MAKMKQFAVDITYTVTETIYVQARRPNGAAEKALTNEAYADSHRYDDCGDNCPHYRLPDGATVTKIREV